jgi:hypothetical protein
MIFRHTIGGGQIGFVVSRQTEGRSQEALASGGPIYADQYITKCHDAPIGKEQSPRFKRSTAQNVPKLFLCASECFTERPALL